VYIASPSLKPGNPQYVFRLTLNRRSKRNPRISKLFKRTQSKKRTSFSSFGIVVVPNPDISQVGRAPLTIQLFKSLVSPLPAWLCAVTAIIFSCCQS
jgi:hypothetical protein